MEIRWIGSIPVGINQTWQIETTQLSVTANGVGFAPFALERPRPLRCSLVGRASTSVALHQEIDNLATSVLGYCRFRQQSKDFAPGVPLVFRDTAGQGDAISTLIEPELRIQSIEHGSMDWIVRVELSGLLLHPPLCIPPQEITRTYIPYSVVPVTTVYTGKQMYTYNLLFNTNTPYWDCLVVIEDGSISSSIIPIPITSVVNGSGTFENITAAYQRWRLTSGSIAQLQYSITVNIPSMLVLPIYVPPSTPESAVCQVSSQLFPTLTIPLVPSTSMYRIAVWDLSLLNKTCSIMLSNVVPGTAVYPIIPVPLEAMTWYVKRTTNHIGTALITSWAPIPSYEYRFGMHRSLGDPPLYGTVYGQQGAVVTTDAKMLIAFVHMQASLSPFDVTTVSYRISPSSFA